MRLPLTFAAIALAATPVLGQATAQPAAKPMPCLTAAEFTALASYALPSVITGAVDRCAATLPSDAWLRRNGSQLAVRYGESKGTAWPDAKAAFLKMGGGVGNREATDLLKSLPDSSLQPMFDALIAGMVGQRLPTQQCANVDRIVRLLSPLPPENTAELIALAAGLGAKSGEAKVGAFSLCPA